MCHNAFTIKTKLFAYRKSKGERYTFKNTGSSHPKYPTYKQFLHLIGKQGCRSGESTRLLPMWPWFKPRRRRHVGSVCCWFRPLLRELFPRNLWFKPSSKTNISKFQFYQESGRRRTILWKCYLEIVIYLFIYLFRYL